MLVLGFWRWLRYVCLVLPPFLPSPSPASCGPLPCRLGPMLTPYPPRRTIYLLASLSLVLYTALRAFRDPSTSSTGFGAARAGPGIPRFYLPIIGDVADRWVGDE